MSDRDLLAHFRPRLCPECGYDLRGLPSLHKCSECGFDIEDALLVQPRSNRFLLVFGIMGLCLLALLLTFYLFDRDWLGVFVWSFLGVAGGISFWWARPRNGLAREQTALLFTRSGMVEYRGRKNRLLDWSEIPLPRLRVLAPVPHTTGSDPLHMWHISIPGQVADLRRSWLSNVLRRRKPDDVPIWTHFYASINEGNALRDEIIRRHTKSNCDKPLTPDA